jgi:DNA-3-methyladenine glycosylase
MFLPGGHAYIYLCYGIHHLLNVVANAAGSPDAVLVRAVEPLAGVATMLERRRMQKRHARMTAGPACLTQAMAITTERDAVDLCDASGPLWIEAGHALDGASIAVGPRVGVGYAGEDAQLPWRFWENSNPWVSRAKH